MSDADSQVTALLAQFVLETKIEAIRENVRREGIRSLVNIAMISALNRPHELKMHVKGALTNGVTRDEMREIFFAVAVYCGVPAGVDAFRVAREVFAEIDKK